MSGGLKALWRLLRWLTVVQWRAIDRDFLEPATAGDGATEPDAAAERSRRSKRSKKRRKSEPAPAPIAAPRRWQSYDLRPLIVLAVVAVSLTLQEYIGQQRTYEDLFRETHRAHEYFQLGGFAWWSGWRVIGYVIMPVIVILAIPGERLRDYFIGFRGFVTHIWIYVGMFVAFFPVIYLFSHSKSFQHTYPFYKLADRSAFDLWAWEAMYAAQFVSLEFFFRGFMLRALAPRFGSQAIFVMIVPYCMIHYGKPLPETLGAIGAGLILGTLAMRTKSIWGGVALHIGVAISMDVLALRNS